MPNKLTNAGFYILRSFKIRPLLSTENEAEGDFGNFVEVSKTITNWAMSESMNSPFLSGTAVIQETDNILEDLPIVGEEECEITYTDFYGDTRTDIFFIYSVENVKPASTINDRMLTYSINFCSRQKLFSDQKEVKKSYANTRISDMVREIYDSYFLTGNKDLDKEIEIEETDGEQTLVIPCLRADAAMQFLSRRAYSSLSKSSLFKFFETRDKYYFCTHEHLIRNKADFGELSEEERNRLFFMYNTVDDNTGDGQLIAQQSISGVNYGTKVNTMTDMKRGGYRKTVTELDIASRTRITRSYDYTTEFKDMDMPEKLKLTHSEDFVNTFMSPVDAPETVLVTDFPQIGMPKGNLNQRKPYQHYYENYTTKPIVDYHMQRNAFKISINGREKLYPGDIINLSLYKFSHTVAATREIDHERSGNYIVTAISHEFSGDNYKQILTITKGGLVA